MNAKLIKVLVTICLVLLSLIALEWFFATQAQQQLLSAANTPAKSSVSEEMPVINLTAHTEESYADLVNRPLFISGRKPIVETGQQQQQTAVITGTFDWRLNGVYTTQKGLTALLTRTVPKPPTPTSKASVENYKKLIVGQAIDGWAITAIHTDNILLTQGANEKKLLLRPPKTKDILGQLPAIPVTTETPTTVVEPAVQPELPLEQPPETEPDPELEPQVDPN